MAFRRRRTAHPHAVPDLTGRVALVTGANSGIGYWTALHLGRAGARVVLGCRSAQRAGAALADLQLAVPDGSFEVLPLDLADLAAVRSAAEDFRSRSDRLDLLVNNAGIALAPFARTTDGFESQFGANFLGHFALTGLLMEVILATPESRVVQVGSLAQHAGRLHFEDLNFERRRYNPWRGYSQSKLANLVHMLELERRLRRTGASAVSVGGHPGASFTGIADRLWIAGVPGIRALAGWLEGKVLNVPELGAAPSIAAATWPDVAGGSYFGPAGWWEIQGPAAPARLSARARSEEDGRRLWAAAEELTGVHYL